MIKPFYGTYSFNQYLLFYNTTRLWRASHLIEQVAHPSLLATASLSVTLVARRSHPKTIRIQANAPTDNSYAAY